MGAITKTLYDIRKKYCARMDDDDSEAKPKRKSRGAVALPYGLCKSVGLETNGLSPKEAWDLYNKYTGINIKEAYRAHFKGGDPPKAYPALRYYKIKSKWFEDKMTKELGSKPVSIREGRTTPKAIHAMTTLENGKKVYVWMPKSVLEDLKVYEWKG